MSFEPVQDSALLFSLPEAALRLEVDESTIREWLSTFSWERHYDGQGTCYLSAKDLGFLRVVKSLRDVDRSCESIVRIIGGEEPTACELLAAPEVTEAPDFTEPAPDPLSANRDQIQALKAELKALHAKPAKKPFWKLW